MKMATQCLAILVVATCLTMVVSGCETIMNPPFITGCKVGEPCPPPEDVYAGYDSKLASDSAVDGGKSDASTDGKGGSDAKSGSTDGSSDTTKDWSKLAKEIPGMYTFEPSEVPGWKQEIKWMMSSGLSTNLCNGDEGFILIVGSVGLCVPSPDSTDDLYLNFDGVKIRNGWIKKLPDGDQSCGSKFVIVMEIIGNITRTYCKVSGPPTKSN